MLLPAEIRHIYMKMYTKHGASHFSTAFSSLYQHTLIFFGISVYNFTTVVVSWTCADTLLVRIPLLSPVFAVCLCIL